MVLGRALYPKKNSHLSGETLMIRSMSFTASMLRKKRDKECRFLIDLSYVIVVMQTPSITCNDIVREYECLLIDTS